MKISIALLAALALSACASPSEPYAELTGRTGAAPGLDISAVDITGIDGKMLFDKKTWREVEPGPHQLQVLTKRKVRRGDQEFRYMYLLAEPCVRYYIVARHFGDVGSTATDWAPEVARTEPIEDCEAKKQSVLDKVMGEATAWVAASFADPPLFAMSPYVDGIR